MKEKKKADKLLQLAVPVLIVMVLFGIWSAKNKGEESAVASNQDATASTSATHPDFILNAVSLDLEQLKSHGLPMMIDFGADSCIPCNEMAPVLKELNAAYRGKVIIKFVDVWKDKSLAKGFPLEVIPTQFFFTADGKPFVPKDPDGMRLLMYSLNDTKEHAYTAHQGGMTKEQILAVFHEMGVR